MNPAARAAKRTLVARLARVLGLLVVAVLAGACRGATRPDPIVNALYIHGAHAVPAADVRNHISTHQSEHSLFGIVPVPWRTRPEYYDASSFRRDLERIERLYQARGYYSASVQAARVSPRANGREVDIDLALREGEPTRVGSVWLSGCEAGTEAVDTPYTVPEEACRAMRRRLRLMPGEIFSEDAFDADRELARDLMRDRGRASARVVARATVDPVAHRAHVVFVLDPGPPAKLGRIELFEGDRPVTGAEFPSGFPTWPVWRALNLRPGQPFSQTAIAEAQRRLFDLGAFGIARIVPDIQRCDSQGGCGDARDPFDPVQGAVANLRIEVSPARRFRWRVGAGVELNQLRSDIHALFQLEHRNFLGGMRQFRFEVRPQLFFQSLFAAAGGFDVGVATTASLRQPELWPLAQGLVNLAADLGPDPFNPLVTHRARAAAGVGVQFQIVPHLAGSAFLRGAAATYYGGFSDLVGGEQGGPVRLRNLDPIYRSLYVDQLYAFLEQGLTLDLRDNVINPRRGFYAAITAQEGTFFLRGLAEVRGYIPLGSNNVVLALHASTGAAAGIAQANGWPVPQELRFYSGGANSNRGYPFNRAGAVATVPRRGCTIPTAPPTDILGVVPVVRTPTADDCFANSDATVPFIAERDANGAPIPHDAREIAVGGLGVFEFSAEVRWYLGNFGVTGFFDASDVRGWTPPAYTRGTFPTDPARLDATSSLTAFPGPSGLFTAPLDLHPSAGLGLRYISPIGVLRLDVGARLDDLTCTRYDLGVAAANNAAGALEGNDRVPSFYPLSRPRCDFVGLKWPIAIAFALGEAF